MNRSQAASLAAHALHAQGGTNTAPAREAFEAKFVALVDPEGKLPPAELAKRVKHAKSVHFARLSHMRSAKKRNSVDDVASGSVWPEEED